MPISECCKKDVICCDRETSLQDVAALMRKHHVGDVVVMQDSGSRIPVGIVTDRDIIIETLALALDARVFTAGDMMTSPLATVGAEEGFVDTLRMMRENRVRRLPVVNGDGTLFGIVTVDDITRLLGQELSMITRIVDEQQGRERALRRS